MYDEIVYHYLPEGLQLNQYDEKNDAIRCLYEHQKLQIYRELCRISGKTPHSTIQECAHKLKDKAPYVNLWDFIDACRTGTQLRTFHDWNDFVSYIMEERTIPSKDARKNEFLAVFLQNLRQGPRRRRRDQVGAPVSASMGPPVGLPARPPVRDQDGPYRGDHYVPQGNDQCRPPAGDQYRPHERNQHRDQHRAEPIPTSTPALTSSKYNLPDNMSLISERSRSSSPCHQSAKSSRSSTPIPAASTQPSSASDINSSAAFIKEEAPLSPEADCAIYFDTLEDDADIEYELSQVPSMPATQRGPLDNGNATFQPSKQHTQPQVKVKKGIGRVR
ncbi:hypothetical protein A1F94_003288 [Pyrenophora tritici-repentis]|uniref:Uncharacterized protein n=2 Tax=Pyrenophora tritici-repentis TaxID=45151 RepID=A0A2W1FQ59_9PLEO|nr:uncharacterized protein PTRG_02737 [Pyrenophora tritici-repentis Pt-1C-BFP]KAF7452195.1 hypothetical protein A1F99_039720 [Pyrenophora tritici-repentis]EDU45260.1 conserved hypothetical protein [Pyrenophora tritici-repentis Pt-1C-BFP]KAG9386538.1 hypothetical protein A1F94_003288 [Pyrenophora tritici-repentis]KAI1518759.1 hypothetical protein Ptr86124_001887 [Pyrenophora tritici-repentis]KAI1672310.1 hypothetical protein L13192_03169 [Pyrenophora tritici-repentis]